MAIQGPTSHGTGCGPSSGRPVRTSNATVDRLRRPATPARTRPTSAGSGARVGQPVGRHADGLHVDDAGLPGSKHSPHPGQRGGLRGIPGHVSIEGGAGPRGVSGNEQGARSLRTAGVGIRGIVSHRCARDGVAGILPRVHLLRCSSATYAIARRIRHPSRSAIATAQRMRNGMTIQAGHGTASRMPVNQPMAITAAERIAPAVTSRSRGPAFLIARPLGDWNRSRASPTSRRTRRAPSLCGPPVRHRPDRVPSPDAASP